MGAWGADSFENDWARDWLANLCEAKDSVPIRESLGFIVKHGGTKRSAPSFLERLRGRKHHTEWLTARDSSKALAAAEVVAAWQGNPSVAFPVQAATWLQGHSTALQSDLLTLAINAVEIVKTNSELKDLWEERNGNQWHSSVANLQRRLQKDFSS